ncbi:hypothetical protein PJI17_32975, partial [Mycobacterium kansasii]
RPDLQGHVQVPELLEELEVGVEMVEDTTVSSSRMDKGRRRKLQNKKSTLQCEEGEWYCILPKLKRRAMNSGCITDG